MPKIHVAQNHSLDRAELLKRVGEYLDILRDDKMKMVEFDYKWSGDQSKVDLTGKGFKGNVVLTDSNVDIKVDLSLMLAPFKGKVEDGLKKGLVKTLA